MGRLTLNILLSFAQFERERENLGLRKARMDTPMPETPRCPPLLRMLTLLSDLRPGQ
jgi:hypothetical protein